MLQIRLQRAGRIHDPASRLVLTDSKNSTKSGRFKEVLGSYDPRKTGEEFKTDRIKHWLSVGAQATDTVHNLLVTHKVIDAKKRNVLPKKTVVAKPLEAETAPDVQPEAQPEVLVEAPEEVSVATPDESDNIEPEATDTPQE